MKILVAPDSFKGSIDAAAFCTIATRAIHDLEPHCIVHSLPLADGGEGTAEALIAAQDCQRIGCEVTGPLGQKVRTFFAYSEREKLAIMDMASASGLPLVPSAQRDPLRASSYGTGELMRAALERGAKHLILGIGGSATNDGGAGMLEALGFNFFDAAGQRLPRGAGGLGALARIDSQSVHPRLARCRIEVACDVTNPLLGPNGASATYGPQKGASPAMVLLLEEALTRFADSVEDYTQKEWRYAAGAGAAGGLGFALLSLCGAELKRGFDLIAERHHLPQKLRDERYDWIITGEGRIDEQSLQGKLLGSIAALAAPYRTPILAFCGQLSLNAEASKRLGSCHLFPIVAGPCDLDQALREAPDLLYQAIQRVFALILSMRKAP